MVNKFWETKSLKQLQPQEWEALCDGCAKCCVHKLEDEDTGIIYSTNVVCQYLDIQQCRCKDYAHRSALVPQCVTLSPENLEQVYFMPATCAYRLLAEGQPLPAWHPLISGSENSVHEAGHSVRDKVISELDADDLIHHLTGEWE